MRSARPSRARAEEPLAATASRIDHWLLVEYRGAWARDVLGDCLFSPELKAHLREQLAALERSRLLFVKKPERRSQTGRRVFFGSSKPGQERFFELEVEHQNDLLGFDFAAALGAGGGGAASRGRGAALRRLHARQAGPVLREAGTSPLRRAAGRGRDRSRLAVDARRRRPLRRKRRRAPARALLRARRTGRRRHAARGPRLRQSSTSTAIAAAAPGRSRCRRRSGRSASRRGSSESATSLSWAPGHRETGRGACVSGRGTRRFTSSTSSRSSRTSPRTSPAKSAEPKRARRHEATAHRVSR